MADGRRKTAVIFPAVEAAQASWRCVAQRVSHDSLYQAAGWPTLSESHTTGAFDAIIVPASRPAPSLRPIIELAASIETLAVILASKQTDLNQVANLIRDIGGAKGLVVYVDDAWSHPDLPHRTMHRRFDKAKASRKSDLSRKRNIGLMLARFLGLSKILFLDDDIQVGGSNEIKDLASQLDTHRIAGMSVRNYPDNSVVCHARRLAGLWQDVFVTGAVLGVQCNGLPLSFFPDIYNEDWFFFAQEAAARRLPRIGEATQSGYDPFQAPSRAREEEFGDLLAEGLFALFDGCDSDTSFDVLLGQANNEYWERFIEARTELITEVRDSLLDLKARSPDPTEVSAAIDSLAAAHDQLTRLIDADLCVDFITEWRKDVMSWQESSLKETPKSARPADTLDHLGLKTWLFVDSARCQVEVSRT